MIALSQSNSTVEWLQISVRPTYKKKDFEVTFLLYSCKTQNTMNSINPSSYQKRVVSHCVSNPLGLLLLTLLVKGKFWVTTLWQRLLLWHFVSLRKCNFKGCINYGSIMTILVVFLSSEPLSQWLYSFSTASSLKSANSENNYQDFANSDVIYIERCLFW